MKFQTNLQDGMDIQTDSCIAQARSQIIKVSRRTGYFYLSLAIYETDE